MKRALFVRAAGLALVLLGGAVTWGSLPGARLSAQEKPIRLRMLTTDGFYVLLGGGANAFVLVRDEEIVLVDSKAPGRTKAMLDVFAEATDLKVTTIVNTHAHADHVGGNVDLPTATRIIAHPNAKAAMAKMDLFSRPGTHGLPTETVADRTTLFEGRDKLDIYHFGAAHTNGDLVVVFPSKRMAVFGDLLPSKAVPIVDRTNGGSALAYPETLAKIAGGIADVNRVVPGHEEGLRDERSRDTASVDITTPRTLTWSEVQEYADFTRDLVAAVRTAAQAGKTVDQTVAELRLPDRYKGYDMSQTRQFVEAAYQELGVK